VSIVTFELRRDLRPADTEVSRAHTVYFRRLLHTTEMQHECTERRVIGVRKRVDQSMHRVASHCVVVNARSVDELRVEVLSKKRIGQFTEELF
jgi:hypothetical protein